MADKDAIFLTMDQAVAAVCTDFRQYAPQTLLFCEVIRLVFGADMAVRRETGKNGVWIRPVGRRRMQWMDGTQLARYLRDALGQVDWQPELLAAVCGRVFQTRAAAAVDPGSGIRGIRIETGMEAFRCRQCGQCCRSLNYQDALTAADVDAWRRLGRTDILEFVGVFERKGHPDAYRIWLTPGTRQLADRCPFLKKVPEKNRWTCRIHDVKPGICRQYPVSRKHARMTGCPGFDDP